jgi:hypothetical protein
LYAAENTKRLKTSILIITIAVKVFVDAGGPALYIGWPRRQLMHTMQRTAALPHTKQTGIRWKRVIVAAVLSELAVIAVISLVMGVYALLIAPGRTSAEYGEFGENAGYYLAAPAAAVAVFVGAFWAVRKLESGFVANGVLVGVIATLLTAGMIVGARPGDRWVYIASFVLRIVAGYAAGVWVQRKMGS